MRYPKQKNEWGQNVLQIRSDQINSMSMPASSMLFSSVLRSSKSGKRHWRIHQSISKAHSWIIDKRIKTDTNQIPMSTQHYLRVSNGNQLSHNIGNLRMPCFLNLGPITIGTVMETMEKVDAKRWQHHELCTISDWLIELQGTTWALLDPYARLSKADGCLRSIFLVTWRYKVHGEMEGWYRLLWWSLYGPKILEWLITLLFELKVHHLGLP